MRFSTTSSIALAAASTCFAAPAARRATAVTDVDILQYALTLEHLEDKFYRQGLARFSAQDFQRAGFSPQLYANLKEVSYDETTHVSFLTTALTGAGAKPVAECTYNFGVTDVKSFIATAAILEGVGVSAYLGAAASIMEKAYLTAAGSILTVESRHSAYLRAGLKESPFPQPFDTPLDFDEVYTLAAPFIVSCPKTNAALPVKAFPALTLDASSKSVTSGKTITLDTKAKNLGAGPYYAAWISVTGPTFTAAKLTNGKFTTSVPSGFHGQSYVVITKSNKSVTDDNVISGPAIVEVMGSNGSPSVWSY